MKASKVILNILSVICFIYGALYIFTLVFIPIGIYCFLAGRRFSYKADNPFDMNYMSNTNFRAYVIFVSFFVFPFGLLAIIPYVKLASNNIKVSSEDGTKIETEFGVFNFERNDEEPQQVSEVKVDETENEQEKLEKYDKLKKFNEKGIITDDELELAREQLFGKKDEK